MAVRSRSFTISLFSLRAVVASGASTVIPHSTTTTVERRHYRRRLPPSGTEPEPDGHRTVVISIVFPPLSPSPRHHRKTVCISGDGTASSPSSCVPPHSVSLSFSISGTVNSSLFIASLPLRDPLPSVLLSYLRFLLSLREILPFLPPCFFVAGGMISRESDDRAICDGERRRVGKNGWLAALEMGERKLGLGRFSLERT